MREAGGCERVGWQSSGSPRRRDTGSHHCRGILGDNVPDNLAENTQTHTSHTLPYCLPTFSLTKFKTLPQSLCAALTHFQLPGRLLQLPDNSSANVITCFMKPVGQQMKSSKVTASTHVAYRLQRLLGWTQKWFQHLQKEFCRKGF